MVHIGAKVPLFSGLVALTINCLSVCPSSRLSLLWRKSGPGSRLPEDKREKNKNNG